MTESSELAVKLGNLPSPKTELCKQFAVHVERLRGAHKDDSDFESFIGGCILEINQLQVPDKVDEMAFAKSSLSGIMQACYDARSMGLRFSRALGHCYIVNRKGFRCEVGYKGYIHLARVSGMWDYVTAECVYDTDKEFEYYRDEVCGRMIHRPSLDRKDSDVKWCKEHLTAVYCQFRKGSFSDVKVFTRNRVNRSDTDTVVWKTHWAEQCRKTAIRLSAKDWDLIDNVALARAIQLDDEGEIIDVEPPQSKLSLQAFN